MASGGPSNLREAFDWSSSRLASSGRSARQPDIGEPAPGASRLPTLEAVELSRTALSPSGALPRQEEPFQHGSVDEQRAAVIDRGQSLLQPMSNGVPMKAEQLGDVVRVVGTASLDARNRDAWPSSP